MAEPCFAVLVLDGALTTASVRWRLVEGLSGSE
jgi:hypothetical protein